jgi:hypothetical protein
MSQFTYNTDLFINKTLQFESNIINVELVPNSITNSKFGILNLKAVSAPLTEEDNDFIFMVDCSSSMSDKCSDGRDKMQHIVHTLQNMILYFKENSSIKIHITIDAFDDSIHRILERTPVNEDNYASIIVKISKIVPRYSTNIELALNSVKNTAKTIRSEFPNINIVNIFMTDGEVTSGSNNHSILSKLVDINITNAFIGGFGIRHDATILNSLSSRHLNSGYYFIDKFENTGLIYGEILHGVVYKLLKDVQIYIQNGLVYDYKNNIWVDILYIGEIVSESNKNYHIISSNPDECVISLLSKKNTSIENDKNVFVTISRIEECADHTKYIYRQRTLQHLYIVTDFITKRNNIHEDQSNTILFRHKNNKPALKEEEEEENTIKGNLRNFIEEMKNYMKEYNMNDDKFMKKLCDDIYICYKTFGNKFEIMYTSARETSQGTQRCYTVCHTPKETHYLYSIKIPILKRQTNNPLPGLTRQINFEMDNFDLLQEGYDVGCDVDKFV